MIQWKIRLTPEASKALTKLHPDSKGLIKKAIKQIWQLPPFSETTPVRFHHFILWFVFPDRFPRSGKEVKKLCALCDLAVYKVTPTSRNLSSFRNSIIY